MRFHRSHLALSFLALVPFLAAAPRASSAGGPAPAEDGAEEALASAELALEQRPEDPAALALAAKSAQAAGDQDRALWYATLGLAAAGDAKEHKDAATELAAIVAGIEVPAAGAGPLLDAYAENLFKLAQLCERSKLYANAVDLLATCRGTPFEGKADERLAKLFDNKKAVEALLESDVEVPAKPATKKSPEWLAKEDAKHQKWADAYEVESKFYNVITNMGYEMAHSISLAMEQMNKFYRKVFKYKQRGGSMRSCQIKVYKTRAEFDAHEDNPDPGVKGFFSPLENRVATYDPRGEGFELKDFWSTLFHEASHQFTEAYTTNLTPGWLNEGTASYFEGAMLLPSGQVRTNQIPVRRLRNLVYLLDDGSPALKDVVSYFQDGSYDGSYYPFGWGLVYFIQNYEDESSERVYLPVYEEYWAAFKTAEIHDPFERFVEYFVEDAKQDDVKTFEDFEKRWTTWIRELHDLYFGPPERSEKLVERARKQLANKKPEYALESYRWAVEKQPDNYLAAYEMADLLEDMKQEDGALYGFRRVYDSARSMRDPSAPMPGFGERTAAEVATDCLARIEKLDRNVHKAMLQADAELIAGVQASAKALQEAGFPRNALQALATANAMVGGSGELEALAESIRDETELDVRRWRRLPVGKGLELWDADDGFRGTDSGVSVQSDGLVMATCREEMADTYRFEATVRSSGGNGTTVFGLVFGSNNSTGEQIFALLPDAGAAGLVRFEDRKPKMFESFPVRPAKKGEPLLMAIEVGYDSVELFVDGKSVGSAKLSPNVLRGHVGLLAQGAEATFEDLRVRY